VNLTCATIAVEFEMAQFIVFCLLLFAMLPSSAGGLGYLRQVMIVHCGLHLMTTEAVSVEMTWEA